MLNLSDGEERLLVSLIPLAQRPGSEPLVLRVLRRHGACSQLGIEMMPSLYGLTGAERRVLKGLIDDVAPQDIADDAGVALSTVRTQIASIRAKLGVSSVQGLLIRPAEVPPFQSALRCEAPTTGPVTIQAVARVQAVTAVDGHRGRPAQAELHA